VKDEAVLTVSVKTTRRLKMPMLPNFILDADGGKVAIQELTQEQLGEVGRAWTEALQRKARDRAAEQTA
jgi:hypothetical protein